MSEIIPGEKNHTYTLPSDIIEIIELADIDRIAMKLNVTDRLALLDVLLTPHVVLRYMHERTIKARRRKQKC